MADKGEHMQTALFGQAEEARGTQQGSQALSPWEVDIVRLAGAEDVDAWTLAQQLGRDRTTVQHSIRKLLDEGWLEDTGAKSGRRKLYRAKAAVAVVLIAAHETLWNEESRQQEAFRIRLGEARRLAEAS